MHAAPSGRLCHGGGRQTGLTAGLSSEQSPPRALSLSSAADTHVVLFPSLLSNPGWRTISSTLKRCSTIGSVSFMAFFPRTTEKRRLLLSALKRTFTSTGSPAPETGSDVASHPSGKQWAAVSTQQAEIRLPPQRNTFSFDLLRQKMAATHGWDSTVATVPPTIFICFLR
ncbi:hypothetical protein EYF80_056698 [Liparis tanakae]|uniref:Uncharacterized protein n=1 Tax=Liparis tanakae TaxID=230148 RepID=A0A4Z2EW03_9TELE|nr:hypothetical protein EYF80_056698 [Liparis tanakae]